MIASEISPVVFSGGMWLVGGLVAYFQRERDRLREDGIELFPGLPPHCLDPVQIAHFLGIQVEDLDWPGPQLSQAASALERLEAKLDMALAARREQPIQQDYLSVVQAARLTGFSYSYIRRAVASGKLVAANSGSALRPIYRIARTDLAAWMEKKKGGTINVPPSSELKDLIDRHLPGLRGRKDSTTR